MDYVSYLASAALGVIGYVGAQFVLKPISELRTTREAIAKSLVLFGNVDTMASPGDVRVQEARGKYRELASTLIAQANSIPFYAAWSCLKITPPFKEIEIASANLIGLSNAVGVQGQSLDNSRRQKYIETALWLKPKPFFKERRFDSTIYATYRHDPHVSTMAKALRATEAELVE